MHAVSILNFALLIHVAFKATVKFKFVHLFIHRDSIEINYLILMRLCRPTPRYLGPALIKNILKKKIKKTIISL